MNEMIIATHNWLNQVGLHETAFLFNGYGVIWIVEHGNGRILTNGKMIK